MSTSLPTTATAAPALRVLAAAWEWVRGLSWKVQALLVLGAATLVARLPGLLFNGLFDRDEAYLAVMGDVLRDGGRLYVDTIDRKPPVVPYAYAALRDLSIDMRMVRLACAVAVMVNGLLVALLVRRLSGRGSAALVAGALAVLGTAWFLPSDAQAANFELWGLAPATGAVLAAVVARSSREHAWRWFALAGALVALAACVKQPYVVVGVPVAWELLRPGRIRLHEGAAALAGAAAVVLSFASVVDLQDLWRWVWADNGDYLDGGLSAGRAAGIGIGLTVVFLCFHIPVLYGVWAAATRRVTGVSTVVVWAVVSLAVVPIGFRFFGHYYQQVVPPLAVLTGMALATASRWVWRGVVATAVLTSVVLLSVSFMLRPDLSNFTALGHYVQTTTDPTDRILVWGAVPDVYVSAQRSPAGVFLHDGYLTGNWASRSTPLSPAAVLGPPYRERWDLFLADLADHPPELIIDGARPGTDWAAYSPSRYPLGPLLERCYLSDVSVDGLQVWRRDHDACPTGG